MSHRSLTALALLGTLATYPARATVADFDPTDRYEVRDIRGWNVLAHGGLLAGHPELADRTLTLLTQQLDQVVRAVPAGAVGALRKVRIWVEEVEQHHPCMAYHPDAGWLRDRGMNPEKARGVEIADARNFLAWTADQPWMVLHELAHGYLDRALEGGFGNAEIRAAYDRALEAGPCDSVLRIGGEDERAYATTNAMEYFAEASEAYFGTNDFYPFVRAELRRHDPEMYALLEKLWRRP